VAFGDADIALRWGLAAAPPAWSAATPVATAPSSPCRARPVAAARKDVKILVVGNPANTNALIAMNNAPDLDPGASRP